MRLKIGYPDEFAERRILMESTGRQSAVESLDAVLDREQVIQLQDRVESVHAESSLIDYLMRVVRATREDPRLRMGVSPRGAIGLFRAARAYALVDARDYLVPDDIQRLVVPCLAHRLLPVGAAAATAEAHDESAAVLEEILAGIPLPV
jgi:MoxR-like ATPase